MINSNEEVTSFNSIILDKLLPTDLKQVVDHIKKNINDSDFYILCQKFVDVALNSGKILDKESNLLKSINLYSDIDEAAKATSDFVKKYSIIRPELLLDMIEKRYHLSISQKDDRQKAGFIPTKDSKASKGSVGTFYSFTKITAWDETKSRILEYIRVIH